MIKKNSAMIFLGALAFLMAACANPFRAGTDSADQAAGASLRLTFSVSASRAIAPTASDIEDAIFIYSVRMFSPGQADITATALAGQSLTIGNLKSGTVWTLYIQALDYANQVVAADYQEGVTILPAGQVTTVTVNLQPGLAAGYGDIMIGYVFPRSLGIDSAIVTLGFEFAKTIPVVVQQIPSSEYDRIDIVQNRVRVGRQLLTVEFKSNGTTIGYVHDLIWVFNGIATVSPDGNIPDGVLTADYFGKAPTAPRNLAMVAGEYSIRLAWTPTSSVADSYVLERAVGDNGLWEALPEGLLSWQYTQYEDWNVVPGAKYRYRVKAVNRFGASTWATGTAVTAPTYPVLLTSRMGPNADINSYWVNGQQRALESGPLGSYTNAIAIEGGNIYVAGSGYPIPVPDSPEMPFYWVNGASTELEADTVVSTIATGIAVRDGDVYVAGFSIDDGDSTPWVWINGVRSRLEEGSAPYGYQTADIGVTYIEGPFGGLRLCVSGVARGTDGAYPVYWIDGKLYELKNPATENGEFSTVDGYPSLALAGNKFAIAATLENKPLYWAGTLGAANLSPKGLSLGRELAAGVADVVLSDGDLFFAGYISGKSYRRPVYWRGASDPIPLALDDAAYDAEATCLEVRGSKIYIGGFIVDRTDGEGTFPLLWIDGAPERLPVDIDGYEVIGMALPPGPAADTTDTSGQGGIYIDASEFLPRTAITGLEASYTPGGVATFDVGFDPDDGIALMLDGGSLSEGWEKSGTQVTWTLPTIIDPGRHRLTVFYTGHGAVLTANGDFACGVGLFGLAGSYEVGGTCAFSTSVPGLAAGNLYGLFVRFAGSEVTTVSNNLSVDAEGVVSFLMPELPGGDYPLEVFVTVDGIDYNALTSVSVVGQP